jgi:hypothetical protein
MDSLRRPMRDLKWSPVNFQSTEIQRGRPGRQFHGNTFHAKAGGGNTIDLERCIRHLEIEPVLRWLASCCSAVPARQWFR